MDTVHSSRESKKTLLTLYFTREKLFLAFLMSRCTKGLLCNIVIHALLIFKYHTTPVHKINNNCHKALLPSAWTFCRYRACTVNIISHYQCIVIRYISKNFNSPLLLTPYKLAVSKKQLSFTNRSFMIKRILYYQ